MARSLLAELIIRLKDGVSGPAKNLTNTLKGVEQAVAAVGKSGNATGLNKTADAMNKAATAARMLAAEGTKLEQLPLSILNKLNKLPTEKVEEFRRQWRQLSQDMANADKAMRATALRNLANDFLLMGSGADKAAQGVRRLGMSAAAARREMAVLSNLTRTFGWGGAAYAFQRGGRLGLTAASEYQREQFRQSMGGIAAGDSAALQGKAMALSLKYKSMDATNINEVGRAIYNMTGDMPKALDLLEDFTRAFIVLQSVKGKEGATKELEDFAKAIDILGRQEKPEELRAILDAALKATQVEGRQLPLTEYLKLAKYAKSAGAALSPEFLGTVAPTIMQEEGGQRFGTALGSTVSQMVGKRMTKRAMNQQIDIGIRRRGDQALLDQELLLSNPYEWAQKHLYPAMLKKGFDGRDAGNEAKVVEFMSSIFSNQMVANAFTKFFTQYEQIERNRNKLYPAAKGGAAADEAIQKDPFVALEGVFAQLRNTFAILGDAGAMDVIVSGLNGLSGAIAKLNEVLSGSSTAANVASGLLAVAGSLVVLRGALALWRLGSAIAGLGAGGAAAGATVGAGAAAAGGAAAGAAGGAAARAAGLAARLGLIARMSPYGAAVGGAWDGLRVIREANEASLAGVEPGQQHNRGLLMRRRANELLRQQTEEIRQGMPQFGNIGGPSTGQFGLGGFKPRIDVQEFTKAEESAERTKAAVEGLNSVTARPHIDTAEIDAAQGKVDRLVASIERIGSAVSGANRRLEQTVRTAARAAYSDYTDGDFS